MNSLYAAEFSNGLIKVGRAIDPQARLRAHQHRLSIVNVEMVAHHIAPCVAGAADAERALIGACRHHTNERSGNEWFRDLDFATVSGFVDQAAAGDLVAIGGRRKKQASSILDPLIERLRQIPVAKWEAVAKAAGCAKTLPRKIATGDRPNPGVLTIQPLIDYFAAVDAGEASLPE